MAAYTNRQAEQFKKNLQELCDEAYAAGVLWIPDHLREMADKLDGGSKPIGAAKDQGGSA
jgi:hypothetical protein